MSKKVLCIVCLCAIASLVSAQGQNPNGALQKQIKRIGQVVTAAIEKSPNIDAVKNNHTIEFDIAETIYHNDFSVGTYDALLGCKSYPLHEHWLLVSNTCLKVSDGDLFDVGDHKYIERVRVKQAPKDLGKFQIFQEGNVMLINTSKNFPAPYIKVLGFSTPQQLFALSGKNTFKINSSRFGWDAIRTRQLEQGSLVNDTFKLSEVPADLSGMFTDPLFLVTPDKNEYLTAYNNAGVDYALQISLDDILHTWDGRKSDTWTSLSDADIAFIKATISKQDPKAWQSVSKRLFVDDPATPYYSK